MEIPAGHVASRYTTRIEPVSTRTLAQVRHGFMRSRGLGCTGENIYESPEL